MPTHIWSPGPAGSQIILGGITGTAVGTLGALTGAATGFFGYRATAAGTLGALTGAAAGVFGYRATGAGTLPVVVGDGTGGAWMRRTSTTFSSTWAERTVSDPSTLWYPRPWTSPELAITIPYSSATGTDGSPLQFATTLLDIGYVYLAIVEASGTVDTAPTFSHAGGDPCTWPLIASASNATSGMSIYAFISSAAITVADSSAYPTVTFPTDPPTGGTIHLIRLSGLNSLIASTDWVRQVGQQANGAAAATPTVSLLTTLPSSLLVGAVAAAANPAAQTPPSGWTELADSGHSLPARGLESAYKLPGDVATTSVTWGDASPTNFAAIVIEIDTAPSGQPTTTWTERTP